MQTQRLLKKLRWGRYWGQRQGQGRRQKAEACVLKARDQSPGEAREEDAAGDGWSAEANR